MTKGIDDYKITFSDQAAKAIQDPKTADAFRDVMAKLRHALADVDMKDRDAVEAVMRATGAEPVDPDDFPEDDHDED